MDSFIVFRSPFEAWEDNWTFVWLQLVYFAFAAVTFRHAWSAGGAARLLWFSAIGHGLWVEGFCYALPELDNFHHGKALVALFGGRMPLYVVVLYPAFYYSAAQLATSLLSIVSGGAIAPLEELRGVEEEVATLSADLLVPTVELSPKGSESSTRRSSSRTRSGLRKRAVAHETVASGDNAVAAGEQAVAAAFAVGSERSLVATAALTGLMTALIDTAYDMLGPKLLHWSWHADDPNVFERSGPFVPVSSYIFHITFSASWLVAGVLAWRSIAASRGSAASAAALTVASVTPFLLGVLQIQAVYVIPHDLYCVPTLTCLALVATIYLAVVLRRVFGERIACVPAQITTRPFLLMDARSSRLRAVFSGLWWFALSFIALAALADPSSLRDTDGIHQAIATAGSCDATTPMMSLGGTVDKSTHLCLVGDSSAPLPDSARPATAVGVRPGSRNGFASLSNVSPSLCGLPSQPLPFRVLLDPSKPASAAAGSSGWTMVGTQWGAEGAASSQWAMIAAVSVPMLLVAMLADAARQWEGGEAALW